MKTLNRYALALLAALFAGAASAGVDTNTSGGLTLKGPGLAVHGHDPVAYFTEGRPVIGTAEHSTVYNDATYRFASAANGLCVMRAA